MKPSSRGTDPPEHGGPAAAAAAATPRSVARAEGPCRADVLLPGETPRPAGGVPDAAGDCTLWVGTSGYSYTDWIEAGFYPPGTRSSEMLRLYARRFPVTELNHTWYQLPRAEAVERQRKLAPPGFLFTAKLTRTLTHEVGQGDGWQEQIAGYRDGIAPLLQARQLLAVLIQLPPRFHRSPTNRRYLTTLLDALEGLPLAVEFRHGSWALDRVFDELQRRRVSLVAVDEPELPDLFPPLDVVTNPELVYVRFHGRNARGWRSGKMLLQFDYDYAEPELSCWLEDKLVPMARQARRGVIFFNNHVRAQATRNAEALAHMLRAQGLSVAEPPPAVAGQDDAPEAGGGEGAEWQQVELGEEWPSGRSST